MTKKDSIEVAVSMMKLAAQILQGVANQDREDLKKIMTAFQVDEFSQIKDMSIYCHAYSLDNEAAATLDAAENVARTVTVLEDAIR